MNAETKRSSIAIVIVLLIAAGLAFAGSQGGQRLMDSRCLRCVSRWHSSFNGSHLFQPTAIAPKNSTT